MDLKIEIYSFSTWPRTDDNTRDTAVLHTWSRQPQPSVPLKNINMWKRASINLYLQVAVITQRTGKKHRIGRSEQHPGSPKSFRSLWIHGGVWLHFSFLRCPPNIFSSPLSPSVSLTYSLFRFPFVYVAASPFSTTQTLSNEISFRAEAVCMHPKRRARQESSQRSAAATQFPLQEDTPSGGSESWTTWDGFMSPVRAWDSASFFFYLCA